MDYADEKLDKRETILNAAQQVFAEKGYYNAKVETIAEQASIAKGTVYLYFASKQELLTALIENRMKRMHTLITKLACEHRDFMSLLKDIIRAHFIFYQNEQDFVKLLYGQLGQVASEMEGAAKRSYDTLQKMVAAILARGIDEGVLCKMDINTMCQSLEGMINAVAFDWVISNRDTTPKALADDVFALFCNGAVVKG
jgi:TetR/AcrR family fatty acid metabolism transcriptional regulator